MPDIDYINAALQERERLRLQQAKEDYTAMQNAGKLSLEDAQESQQIREDIGTRLQKNVPISYEGFQRSVLENPSAMGPNQPGGDYGMPSREDYQKYFVEGQAPPKATPTYSEFKGQPVWDQRPMENIGLPPYVNQQPQEQIPAAVAEAIGQRQPSAPSRAQRQPAAQQQAPAQPQRPMTIREQIDMLPFAGDRYEANRKVMESAKTQKLNQLNAVADQMMQQGYPFADVKSFLEIKKAQVDANFVVPKPIEETEDFKTAQRAIVDGKHADRIFMLAEMKNILEAAKIEKTKDGKVALLEPTMGKLLQSIAAGADAMQPAEAQRIISELTNIVQSPGESLELIGRRGFIGAFSKDPDAFIEKASKILNSTLPAVNERTAFYHDNLGSAFKKLGVGYVTPIGAKNQGIDMTKLQQLREGTNPQKPVLSQTNPADRPASKGPQIVSGMRFGTAVPSSMSYGSKPIQLGF
jgi:hypothetical protein